jgi:hypothetical protein
VQDGSELSTSRHTSTLNRKAFMNRSTYRQARRMVRENGRYALNWMQHDVRTVFDHLLFNTQDATDLLAEREWIVRYCKRENLSYTFRNLAN